MTEFKVQRDLLCSRLFAELLALALPMVQWYRSDLYRDACWLADYIDADTDGCEFTYGVREHGTHIGTDEDLIAQYSVRVYRFTIRPHERYREELVVTVSGG